MWGRFKRKFGILRKDSMKIIRICWEDMVGKILKIRRFTSEDLTIIVGFEEATGNYYVLEEISKSVIDLSY